MRNTVLLTLASITSLYAQKPGDDFGGYPVPQTFPGCDDLGFVAAVAALFSYGYPGMGYLAAVLALAYATWCG